MQVVLRWPPRFCKAWVLGGHKSHQRALHVCGPHRQYNLTGRSREAARQDEVLCIAMQLFFWGRGWETLHVQQATLLASC